MPIDSSEKVYTETKVWTEIENLINIQVYKNYTLSYISNLSCSTRKSELPVIQMPFAPSTFQNVHACCIF